MPLPYIELGSEPLAAALLSTVEIDQRLNDHWTCRLVLRDTPDRRPPVEEFAGKELKITTYDVLGGEWIVFQGPVRHVELIYEVTGAYGARIEAVSARWGMAQGTRQRYFKQETAQAVLQQVVSGAGLAMTGAMPVGENLSYVQWEETDFSFAARLVDDVEAWFRPAVDGSSGFEVQTSFQQGTTVNWREGEYGLLEWTTRGSLGPVTAEGANYDFQAMQSKVCGPTHSEAGTFGDAATRMVGAAGAASGKVEAMWADRNRATTVPAMQQRLEREARRGVVSTVLCQGTSRSPQVRAGDTVEVTGLDEVNGTYGVVEVHHRWTTQGYENQFWATPWQRWSPRVRPARPMLDGVYPARVVANHDPHNQGRVRVKYFWQDANETTWVRLLTAHAGPGRGMLFYPEVGDEVLVAFEEGDAERPYVVGSAWNGVHQPPATGFHQPGETNGSEFQANNIKRVVTKSGHRITMVDTPGKETISLSTPTNNRLMLTENHKDTGRPAIVLETQGDMVLAAPQGRIHTQSLLHSREVGVKGAAVAKAAAAAPPAKASAAAAPASAVAKSAGPKKDTDTDGSLIGKGCQPLTQKQQPGQHLSKDQINGAWGSAYHSDSACCQAQRAAGKGPKRIVYVNGIQTDQAAQCQTLQKISKQTCADVLGVHNATTGFIGDMRQVMKDRSLVSQAQEGKAVPIADGRNPAVDSMDDVIYNSVQQPNPPEIWAHSQGGAIASLAAYQSNLRLKQYGLGSDMSHLQVKSFASAAPSWPPSISAQHYVNVQDLVPMYTGLGGDPSSDSYTTGPRQQVIRFQGAPGATNPTILSSKDLAAMNQTFTAGEGIPVNGMPPVSPTAYHSIDSTYLNAEKKVNGGC